MSATAKLLSAIALALLVACGAKPPPAVEAPAESSAFIKRAFNPMLDGRWIGNGISYGAYRDGEGPDSGTLTSKAHILEDLELVASRWNFIRLYGSGQQSRNIIEVIHENRLPIRVMQGAWVSEHQTPEQNSEQLEGAIALANDFPDIVVAVNVGNEILVDWSAHRISDIDKVVGYIRDVRRRVSQPVSVNDDYNFWNKPHAKTIADEVDFIGLHAYAFWNDKTLNEAMAWTEAVYQDIQGRYPEHLIAYCETGWPTSRIYDDGSYEGGLIGKAGETEQQVFFDAYDAWVNANRVVSLYFEAFDEKWKGGFDGDNPTAKAEKHWGLYRSDRTPKQALQ